MYAFDAAGTRAPPVTVDRANPDGDATVGGRTGRTARRGVGRGAVSVDMGDDGDELTDVGDDRPAFVGGNIGVVILGGANADLLDFACTGIFLILTDGDDGDTGDDVGPNFDPPLPYIDMPYDDADSDRDGRRPLLLGDDADGDG